LPEWPVPTSQLERVVDVNFFQNNARHELPVRPTGYTIKETRGRRVSAAYEDSVERCREGGWSSCAGHLPRYEAETGKHVARRPGISDQFDTEADFGDQGVRWL
jgi:hypothetical protein